jgi:hypothetical protein
MEDYKKSFSFIDADNHRANITAEITHRNGYAEFTACGDYCGSGGQCLDQIKTRTHDQGVFIHLWKEYHLKNIEDLPANVKFWPDFHGHLTGIIDAIEKEQAERDAEKKEEEKSKNEDEKLLAKMEEYGIDEDQVNTCRAYLDAMNIDDLKDFEESYNGQWADDEDFAKNMAEDIGSIKDDMNWPYTCIDWKKAARELMMDYTEQDGFYFRNI